MVLEGDGVSTPPRNRDGAELCLSLRVLQKRAPKPNGVALDRDPVGHHCRVGLCVGGRPGGKPDNFYKKQLE